MSFDTYETSTNQGSPVTLYKFLMGSQSFYLTSYDRDFSLSGNTYTSAQISHDTVKCTTDSSRSSVTINMDSHIDLATYLLSNPVDEVCDISIIRTHAEDPDKEFKYIWRGYLSNTGIDGLETAVLTCSHLLMKLDAKGLRAGMSATCTKILYGEFCRAALTSDLYEETTVVDVSGKVIKLASFGSSTDVSFWVGGYVQYGTNYNRCRAISGEDYGNKTVTVDLPVPNLNIGDAIKVVAGCDHIATTCHDKFNNLPNYGGWLTTPDINPFTQGLGG